MTHRNAQETLDNIQHELNQICEPHLFTILDRQVLSKVMYDTYRTFNLAKSRGEVSQYEVHSFYYNIIVAFQLNHFETMNEDGKQKWVYVKLEFDPTDPVDVLHVGSLGSHYETYAKPYFKFKTVNVFLGERRRPIKNYWYQEHADQNYYDDFYEGILD